MLNETRKQKQPKITLEVRANRAHALSGLEQVYTEHARATIRHQRALKMLPLLMRIESQKAG